MIVTVPAATRSVRVWAQGDSTIIEVDGLSEHGSMSALFGIETRKPMDAPPSRRRLRAPTAAATAVVVAAFLVGLGIHLLSGANRPGSDGALAGAGQAEAAQPWAAPAPPGPPPVIPEVAPPGQPAPAHATASPNAAFGLD